MHNPNINNQILAEAIQKWPLDQCALPSSNPIETYQHLFKSSIPYNLNPHTFDGAIAKEPKQYIHLTFDTVTLGIHDQPLNPQTPRPDNKHTPANNIWQPAIAYRYHIHPNETISEKTIPYNLSHCLSNPQKPLTKKTFKGTERLVALAACLAVALADKSVSQARAALPLIIHVPHAGLCGSIYHCLTSGLANYRIQRSSTIFRHHPVCVKAIERIIHYTQAIPVLSVQFMHQQTRIQVVKSKYDKSQMARLANHIPEAYTTITEKIHPNTLPIKTMNDNVNHQLQKQYPSYFPYLSSSTLRNKPFKAYFSHVKPPRVVKPKR